VRWHYPVIVLSVVGSLPACSSCSKNDVGVGPEASASVPSSSATTVSSAAPVQHGMVWVPAGKLHVGTPVGRVPRIAEEELTGDEVDMGAFYIDLLPYPNESGAIPTTNVTRDDAQRLCEAQGKRLCTELEWERSCKGPDNFVYEYGDTYKPQICGTGISVEEAARHPSGDHVACKSGFGALELHGDVWEWTQSSWGRGRTDALGVLRGGNSVAGELAGRCANGIGRAPTQKSPSMGFRCCKGDVNPAVVDLKLSTGRILEPLAKTDAARVGRVARASSGGVVPAGKGFFVTSTWNWRPVPNEVLQVASGCAGAEHGKPFGCALVVYRADDTRDLPLAAVTVDVGIVEMAVAGEAKHIRVRGLQSKGGLIARDITYAYGHVEIGEPVTK